MEMQIESYLDAVAQLRVNSVWQTKGCGCDVGELVLQAACDTYGCQMCVYSSLTGPDMFALHLAWVAVPGREHFDCVVLRSDTLPRTA